MNNNISLSSHRSILSTDEMESLERGLETKDVAKPHSLGSKVIRKLGSTGLFRKIAKMKNSGFPSIGKIDRTLEEIVGNISTKERLSTRDQRVILSLLNKIDAFAQTYFGKGKQSLIAQKTAHIRRVVSEKEVMNSLASLPRLTGGASTNVSSKESNILGSTSDATDKSFMENVDDALDQVIDKLEQGTNLNDRQKKELQNALEQIEDFIAPLPGETKRDSVEEKSDRIRELMFLTDLQETLSSGPKLKNSKSIQRTIKQILSDPQKTKANHTTVVEKLCDTLTDQVNQKTPLTTEQKNTIRSFLKKMNTIAKGSLRKTDQEQIAERTRQIEATLSQREIIQHLSSNPLLTDTTAKDLASTTTLDVIVKSGDLFTNLLGSSLYEIANNLMAKDSISTSEKNATLILLQKARDFSSKHLRESEQLLLAPKLDQIQNLLLRKAITQELATNSLTSKAVSKQIDQMDVQEATDEAFIGLTHDALKEIRAEVKWRNLTQDQVGSVIDLLGQLDAFAKACLGEVEYHKIAAEIGKIKTLLLEQTNETTPPQLAATLETLKKADDPNLSLSERANMTPVPPEAQGFSGSYVMGQKGQRYVVKPALQEEGLVSRTIGQGESVSGIPPGQGVVREVLAAVIDQELDIGGGVPDTRMIEAKYSGFAFKENMPLETAIEKIGNALELPMSRKQFLKLLTPDKGKAETQDTCWKAFQENCLKMLEKEMDALFSQGDPLEAHVKACLSDKEFVDQALAIIQNQTLFPEQQQEELAKLLLENNDHLGQCPEDLPPILISLMIVKHTPGLIQNDFTAAWTALTSPPPTETLVASCQSFEEGCVPAETLSDDEWKQINPKECEKCAPDILMLNTDGGIQNILIKRAPRTESYKEVRKLGVSKEDLNDLVKHYKKQKNQGPPNVSYLLANLDESKRTPENERLLSNWVFAKANGHESIYSFVLIDHAVSLPDLSTREARSNAYALHEWADDPFPDVQFSGLARERIVNLDVDQFVARIKHKQELMKAKYGASCDLASICFDTLKLNALLMKKGVKAGLSMRQINSFLTKQGDRSPLNQFITDHIQGRNPVDWEQVEKDLDLYIQELHNSQKT